MDRAASKTADFTRLLATLWWCWLLSAVLSPARTSHAALLESFESSVPTWHLADADCQVRIGVQQRTLQHAHGGQGCEYLQIRAGRGSYVYVTHPVSRAPMIEELGASLWIKADRPGIQLLARVVLPRSRDPSSGAPLTTLVHGTLYDRVGLWQQLNIADMAGTLARQLPVLREQFGREVDPREAYVDLIVLNVYGQAGVTNVWIDDLEIAGHVALDGPASDTRPANRLDAQRVALDGADRRAASADRYDRGARMRGWVLEADGQPLMVRMIQHNGESFEWLLGLGFNTIRLDHPPTQSELEQARRLGLWLTAPPPRVDRSEAITSSHDRVLAWDLGQRLTHRELEATGATANAVRRADPQKGRPLVCGADDHLWQYSRIVDVLMLDRSPLGSSQELADYRAWLIERSRLVRAGTPIWATVPTEINPALMAQLSTDGAPTIDIDPQQMRLLAYHALSASARGLYFPSRSALDGRTESSRLRALALRLLNRELSLVEPWAAAGSHLADVEAIGADVSVTVLQTERSRLAIALRNSAAQQYVVGPPQSQAVSFVVPNVPASARAYVVTPVGFHSPKNRRRDSGGMRITLESVPRVSLVVLTEDPLVVNHLSRRLAQQRQEVAALQYDISAYQLALVESIDRVLAGQSQPLPAADHWLHQAKANLQQSRQLIDAGDPESGFDFARRAQWSLSKVCRGHWKHAVGAFPSAATSPYCACFATLPMHWQMARQMSTARWGGNALAAGDMENLDQMLHSGWRHFQRSESSVHGTVELSSREVRSGRSSLRMAASAPAQQEPPEVVEFAPVWISSAAVGVRAGQWVRIHGWAKLPHELTGSRDGLMVFDSLAGPALAERIRYCSDWREFTLYRRAPRDGQLTITFALSGLGEAWIDDVSVHLLDLPGPAPLGPTASFDRAGPTNQALAPRR